jgi:hypothetical protein
MRVCDLPSKEQYSAGIVQFLLDGQDYDAASLMLACELEVESFGFFREGEPVEIYWDAPEHPVEWVLIAFKSPHLVYDIVHTPDAPMHATIWKAVRAFFPPDVKMEFQIRAKPTDPDPAWREELLAIARGKDVHNQAADLGNARTWQNLRFRSQSEVKIAEALDRAKVFFLPNCKGRLGIDTRRNLEADFLICHKGRWGILEVDGEPFHPPTRTVHDHSRDRLFKDHGLAVVEHFDSEECFQQPDKVVARFLRLLFCPVWCT